MRAIARKKKRRYTRDTRVLSLLPVNRRFLYASKENVAFQFFPPDNFFLICTFNHALDVIRVLIDCLIEVDVAVL